MTLSTTKCWTQETLHRSVRTTLSKKTRLHFCHRCLWTLVLCQFDFKNESLYKPCLCRLVLVVIKHLRRHHVSYERGQLLLQYHTQSQPSLCNRTHAQVLCHYRETLPKSVITQSQQSTSLDLQFESDSSLWHLALSGMSLLNVYAGLCQLHTKAAQEMCYQSH